MANAYSHLHNYAQDLYTPNFDLIGQVLQYKQGKLDSNRAQLQKFSDTISILDVAKEEDKDYVEGRLNTARDISNKYAALDLSQDGLTNDLISKLSSVVDDNVKTAVLSTKVLRSEQQAWAKLKTDSPELYNATNQGYAMQGANEWLRDGEVGKKYNGGGGVIEYQDLSTKIIDNIPALQKALYAKWVATGPKEGYFESLETFEIVDRDKMDEALSTLFNDKDRAQMRINAWGQYDKMPEEQLKGQYNSFIGNEISLREKSISSAVSAKASAKTDSDKALYDKVISSHKAEIANLNANKYDALVSTGGKASAYNTLYNVGFKKSILDAYSYGPRRIAREVDAVSKANAEYALKLRDDKRKQEKHEIEVLKTKKVAGTSELPEGYTNAGNVLMDPDKEAVIGGTEALYEEQDAILSQMSQLLDNSEEHFEPGQYVRQDKGDGVIGSILNGGGKLDQLSSQAEWANGSKSRNVNLTSEAFINDIRGLHNLPTVVKGGKEFISIGGKDVEFTDENFRILEEYKHNVLQNSSRKKIAFEVLDPMVEALENQLSEASIYESRMSVAGLPNFNFELTSNKNGKTEFTKRGGGSNNYERLVRKGVSNLNPSEKSTLDMYVLLHMYQDDSLTDTQARLIKDKINNIRGGFNNTDDLIFSRDGAGGAPVPNTFGTTVHKYTDYHLSEFTKGDVKDSRLTTVRGASSEKLRGELLEGSERLATMDESFFDRRTQGLDKIIENGFTQVDSNITDKHLASEGKLAQGDSFEVSTDADDYQQYKSKLVDGAGNPIGDPKYNRSIYVGPDFDETNTITDKVNLKYEVPVMVDGKQAGYEWAEISVDKSKFSNLSVDFEKSRTPYDATNPEARAIEFGSYGKGKISVEQKNELAFSDVGANKVYQEQVSTINSYTKKYEISEERANGIKAGVKSEIARIKAGELSISIVPVNNSEYLVKVDGSTLESLSKGPALFAISDGATVSRLELSSRADFMRNSDEWLDYYYGKYLETFTNYLTFNE